MKKLNLKYNEQLQDIFKQHIFTCGKILSSKKFAFLKKYVLDQTSFLVGNINLTTRVFYVLNNVTEQVKCLTCGKILKHGNLKNRKYENFRDAFSKFCCPKCELENIEVQEKLKQTNLKKYGCEWQLHSDSSKQKTKQTMLEKYGCEYAQQNKYIKQKSYDSMLKHYGVKFTTQSEKLLKKCKKSRRESEYEKFAANEYVKPLFTKEQYVKNGNIFSYTWKCEKCHTVFKSCKNDIWFKEGAVKSYARCEKCYPVNENNGSSFFEKQIHQFVSQLGISSLNHLHENRKIISPYELDIYIPEKKLAIEFDGLYWHNADKVHKNYHLKKTELCEKQGIQLIHIFENEWIYKQDIVKSRLKNLLGIYDKTIYARKCEVREIDPKTSQNFQEQNHIQGAVNSSINLGLYFENELISLMTFGKSRFNKKYEWELLRFCNKLNYHIPGAAGKLLKYFERNYHPKSIISYADRRWSQGKLYKALGFNLDHSSAPNYWYFKANKLYSRIQFQKFKLKNILQNFDPKFTEIQNMKNNGFSQIYDCGNLVFVKNYDPVQ